MNRFLPAVLVWAFYAGLGMALPAVADDSAQYDEALADDSTGYRVLQRNYLMPSDQSRDGFFLTIHFENKRWVADQISPTMPPRSSRSQEIFFVSKDKARWYLAAPKDIANCSSKLTKTIQPYTLCNSVFGTFSGVGAFASVLTSFGASMLAEKPTTADDNRLEKAVYSVSEAGLDKLVTEYLAVARSR